MRISDWSSDVCSSDLVAMLVLAAGSALSAFQELSALARNHREVRYLVTPSNYVASLSKVLLATPPGPARPLLPIGEDARELPRAAGARPRLLVRSEEPTSELQH